MTVRFRTIFSGLLAPCAAWALATAAASPAASERPEEMAQAMMLESLRAQDLRVATVAFRLVTAGLPLCGGRAPQAGLVLHDAAQYGAALRAVAIRHFGLGEGPSISAVVPGGPADLAGLRADDAVLAIDGARIVETEGSGRGGTYDGVARAVAALDGAMAQGAARLTVQRGEKLFEAELRPAIACRSDVQLIPSSRMNAAADGRYVQVTSAIVDYVRGDDELAVVIGHELAHNILGHRARLDAAGVGTGLFSKFGRNAARIRKTEVEADRLGLRLMALAGYDLEAAPSFWRRFGKEHGHGIFADATHPGWRKREAMLTEAIGELKAKKGPIQMDRP